MRFAVVTRSPTLGARVRAVDDAAARAMPGVSAVVTIDADALPDLGENSPKPPNGVAVVADSTWAALQARERLRIDWERGPGANESTSALTRAGPPPRPADARSGSSAPTATSTPPCAAPPAPSTSSTSSRSSPTHRWSRSPAPPGARPDRCELWAPTQDPAAARDAAAKVSGLPAAQIVVHPLRMGGGFGRRYYHDMVVEAVVVSRAVGAPVQVVWTREDDMRHGFYRPGSLHRMRGGVDERGRPIAWETHLVNASRGEFLRWALPPGATEFPAGADLGTLRPPGRPHPQPAPAGEQDLHPHPARPVARDRRGDQRVRHASASSTNWRTSPAATRWTLQLELLGPPRSCRTTTTPLTPGTRVVWRGCCAPPPNVPAGERRCRPDTAAASPAATPTRRTPRWSPKS